MGMLGIDKIGWYSNKPKEPLKTNIDATNFSAQALSVLSILNLNNQATLAINLWQAAPLKIKDLHQTAA